MTEVQASKTSLRRSIGLPLLVFYGVGVTVGAGIFALIGEIVRTAGDSAPLAFMLAGTIAGATALSYAKLSSVYPRAAGEAIYVNVGLGKWPARMVGYGVTLTAIVSSAVIAQAFSGYLGSLITVAPPILIVGILIALGFVAWLGVRESLAFAAFVTFLEVGTLLIVIFSGISLLSDSEMVTRIVTPPVTWAGWSLVFSAAFIAFFAFVGFEDIVNMAEETINPSHVLPRAVILTLIITIVLYALIAAIAVAAPDRAALVNSDAPLAVLFQSVTGYSGKPVSAMASIAMINGILVQIVMASRVIYGMAREGLAPAFLGVLNPGRQTPGRATLLVTGLIMALALSLPLVRLAQATSLITLSVFFLVNLALWRIGARPHAAAVLKRWRYWGALGALLSAGLLSVELLRMTASLWA